MPQDRGPRRGRRPMKRRDFLRRVATTAGTLPLAGSLLAACERASGRRASGGRASGSPHPDRPVRWPLHDATPPIEAGLPVERGATLRIYQWREYLYDDVLASFARRHADADVRVHVESFETMPEAIARLRRPDSAFDVFFPTVDALGELISARMLRPLTHEYLRNVRNLWPQFLGPDRPFYDQGQRYTVPYTVYSSGIGWRTDLVARGASPPELENPYDAVWRRHRAPVGIYDDYREAIAMALLRNGVADLEAAGRHMLSRAGDELVQLVNGLGARITAEGAYEGLPSGRFAMHQAWSGDLISGVRHAGRGTEDLLGYWWPMGASPGVVGCDLTAICSQGKNPVLAHAFVDHLLDTSVAMRNFSWNGYQPPMSGITREAFADPEFRWHRLVPPALRCAIVSPEEFERGLVLSEPPRARDLLWLDQWERVLRGGAAA